METTHYLVYRVVVAWELLSLPSSGFANVAMRSTCSRIRASGVVRAVNKDFKVVFRRWSPLCLVLSQCIKFTGPSKKVMQFLLVVDLVKDVSIAILSSQCLHGRPSPILFSFVLSISAGIACFT